MRRRRSVSRCPTADGPGVRRPCDTFDTFDIFDIFGSFRRFTRGDRGAAWRQRLQRETLVRTPDATASRTEPSGWRKREPDPVAPVLPRDGRRTSRPSQSPGSSGKFRNFNLTFPDLAVPGSRRTAGGVTDAAGTTPLGIGSKTARGREVIAIV
jgi:hypothetical protein